MTDIDKEQQRKIIEDYIKEIERLRGEIQGLKSELLGMKDYIEYYIEWSKL